MAIKLEVKNLYKIFGEHPERAFKLLDKGLTKDRLFEKTGLSLGVKDATLAIEEGEIFVIMGLSGSGKSTPGTPSQSSDRTHPRSGADRR